jgi:hypothetical protein
MEYFGSTVGTISDRMVGDIEMILVKSMPEGIQTVIPNSFGRNREQKDKAKSPNATVAKENNTNCMASDDRIMDKMQRKTWLGQARRVETAQSDTQRIGRNIQTQT